MDQILITNNLILIIFILIKIIWKIKIFNVNQFLKSINCFKRIKRIKIYQIINRTQTRISTD
jgi:hypothetical protein